MIASSLLKDLLIQPRVLDWSTIQENGDYLDRIFSESLNFISKAKNPLHLFTYIHSKLCDLPDKYISINCETKPGVRDNLYKPWQKNRIYTLDIALKRHGLWIDGAICFCLGSLDTPRKNLVDHMTDGMNYLFQNINCGESFLGIVESYKWSNNFIELEKNMGGHSMGTELHELPEFIYDDPIDYTFLNTEYFTIEPVFKINEEQGVVYLHSEKSILLSKGEKTHYPTHKDIFFQIPVDTF